MNREIKNYLHIFINYRQDDWVDWLPLAVFYAGNKRHESTPNTLLYSCTMVFIPSQVSRLDEKGKRSLWIRLSSVK